MNKNEVLREISELVDMYQNTIQKHENRNLVTTYETLVEEITNNQVSLWALPMSLGIDEMLLIQKYIATASFMSAWLHLCRDKNARDKASHSCCTIISTLGVDPDKVFIHFLEVEQIWLGVMEKVKVSPTKAGCFTIFIVTVIVFISLIILI